MIDLNLLETFRTKEELINYFDENGVEQTITKVLTKELMENVKTQVEELSLTRDESSHLSHLLNYYDQLVKNLS